jgi:hypothetical protein
MHTPRHVRSGKAAAPPIPMVNFENGVAGYREPTDGSSTSTSLASSPTEAAYLTYNSDVEGTTRRSALTKVPSFLRCLPSPLMELYETSASRVKSPQPARQHQIKPLFERLQTAPIRLLHQAVPKYTRRVLMLCGYYILWLSMFILIIHKSTTTGGIGSYGPPVRLSCVSRLW